MTLAPMKAKAILLLAAFGAIASETAVGGATGLRMNMIGLQHIVDAHNRRAAATVLAAHENHEKVLVVPLAVPVRVPVPVAVAVDAQAISAKNESVQVGTVQTTAYRILSCMQDYLSSVQRQNQIGEEARAFRTHGHAPRTIAAVSPHHSDDMAHTTVGDQWDEYDTVPEFPAAASPAPTRQRVQTPAVLSLAEIWSLEKILQSMAVGWI